MTTTDSLIETEQTLRIPAIEVKQGPNRTLYTFAIDGKQLPKVATIARIRRDEDAQLQGYQRTAVTSHINAIKRYIESADAMLPNALVVAFDKRVTFEPAKGAPADGHSRAGTLMIPVDEEWSESDKPGWIVDGQQRSSAIRQARVESFPVCVTAFITDDAAEQRSQFILVNNTKPLPKGLIHELLPTASGQLPLPLQLRQFPALLLERLNYDEDSPLRHRIHTTTMPDGFVKDNSILRMLEHSLDNGALHEYRNAGAGDGDVASMLRVLKNYWTGVSKVFSLPWDLKPTKSRLTHGVGIISLGFVMDEIIKIKSNGQELTVEDFVVELKALAPICRWTQGNWEFKDGSTRKWNELQNTSKDIQLLTNHLLDCYRRHAKPARKRSSAR